MRRRAARRASLAGLVLVSAGCAITTPHVAVPEVGFAYSAGQGSQTFAAPPGVVGPAVVESLGDLGMKDVRPLRDGTVLRYEAVTSDDRSASVTIRSRGGAATAVARVGWFGDEPLSRAILQRVAVRLGERAPEPIPEEAPSKPSANPFFSRSAVPDSVMLRDQADAAYTDRVVP
ncbi:DUF3568 family protein [Paludisphaera mucosa]|uniref:DUF3568 family protein n=1 Tax=Paludisphaera mucosa TaxID=3030827 RepID=A0ABT6FDJ8_9BACT|nr:DUF3568 family protein [Paludisphaera mucosa]MDG3005640.1 DUF3568 family protein [Paludisphaera mucosa]